MFLSQMQVGHGHVFPFLLSFSTKYGLSQFWKKFSLNGAPCNCHTGTVVLLRRRLDVVELCYFVFCRKENKDFFGTTEVGFPTKKLHLIEIEKSSQLYLFPVPRKLFCLVTHVGAMPHKDLKKLSPSDMDKLRAVLEGKNGLAMWKELGRLSLSPKSKVGSHT